MNLINDDLIIKQSDWMKKVAKQKARPSDPLP